MCVTDLPGDPDGVLVLHDVMELVDNAFDPMEGSTAVDAAPIEFDSDDEDLDVPQLRPRSSRRKRSDQRTVTDGSSSDDAIITSLRAPSAFHGSMLELSTDEDEEPMGGVYHGAVTAKLKQPESWRVKSTITEVRVEKPKQKPLKSSPRQRMNAKDEVQYLRERVRQLQQTLETLRLQALADKEKAMETAIVFNLVPQPDLLAPNKVPGTPEPNTDKQTGVGSPAAVDSIQGSPARTTESTDGLWERIATFQKAEYEKSMRQNKRLRALAEQQLRALKQLEVAFRNPRAVSQ